MNIDDLNYIFDSQIKEGTDKLYFMLVDGDNTPLVSRCLVSELETMLPMFDSFQYAGVSGTIPRFVK